MTETPYTLACGHTVRDPSQTHYCTYLRLPELLTLQPAPDQVRHPDVHLFVVPHQSFAVWFGQLRADLPRTYVARDDYRADMREIKEMLGKIFDRLDGKADK